MNKFCIRKVYGTTHTGAERVLWNVVSTANLDDVIDTFSLRRDAKFYCELWNSEAARNCAIINT